MAYLLDTDMCIYLIKEKPLSVIQTLQKKKPLEIGISSITFAELNYGVEKSKEVQKNAFALTKMVSCLQVLSFDDDAALSYGKIRAALERKGDLIGSMDMLIAAHALALGWTVVTNNEREFKKVKGLMIENWTK